MANYPCDQRKSKENKKKGYWDWRWTAGKPALGWDMVFPTDRSFYFMPYWFILHKT